MAAAANRERVEELEDEVDRLEKRIRDLEVALWLPWPLRLIGLWF